MPVIMVNKNGLLQSCTSVTKLDREITTLRLLKAFFQNKLIFRFTNLNVYGHTYDFPQRYLTFFFKVQI